MIVEPQIVRGKLGVEPIRIGLENAIPEDASYLRIGLDGTDRGDPHLWYRGQPVDQNHGDFRIASQAGVSGFGPSAALTPAAFISSRRRGAPRLHEWTARPTPHLITSHLLHCCSFFRSLFPEVGRPPIFCRGLNCSSIWSVRRQTGYPTTVTGRLITSSADGGTPASSAAP
jgi:hypothetical protein